MCFRGNSRKLDKKFIEHIKKAINVKELVVVASKGPFKIVSKGELSALNETAGKVKQSLKAKVHLFDADNESVPNNSSSKIP